MKDTVAHDKCFLPTFKPAMNNSQHSPTLASVKFRLISVSEATAIFLIHSKT